MKLWDKIKARFAKNDAVIPSWPAFFGGGDGGQYGADISEITYFTCLKTLSEALGKMPVHLVDAEKKRQPHETTRIVETQVNNVQTTRAVFHSNGICAEPLRERIRLYSAGRTRARFGVVSALSARRADMDK